MCRRPWIHPKKYPVMKEIFFSRKESRPIIFFLLKGRVLLSQGKEGPAVHMARHAGEFIGWSTLTGRDFFSASAKCLEPASLLNFERDRFLRILETNTENAAILFKRLAKTLGKRLIETYPTTG